MWTKGSWITAVVQAFVWRASTFGMGWISIAAHWLGATFGRSNCNRANTSPKLASCGLLPGIAQWVGLLRWADFMNRSHGLMWGITNPIFFNECNLFSERYRLVLAKRTISFWVAILFMPIDDC